MAFTRSRPAPRTEDRRKPHNDGREAANERVANEAPVKGEKPRAEYPGSIHTA